MASTLQSCSLAISSGAHASASTFQTSSRQSGSLAAIHPSIFRSSRSIPSVKRRVFSARSSLPTGGRHSSSNPATSQHSSDAAELASLLQGPKVEALAAEVRSSKVEVEEPKDAHSQTGGGTILGAIALITGTSVGAGILALPTETSSAGFIPSATMLCACWAFLSLEALLLAEVNINLLEKRKQDPSKKSSSSVLSLRSMADATLGPIGGALATFTYVFLSYALQVAYFAKAGEVLSFGSDLPEWLGAVAFAGLMGGLVYGSSTRTTDVINQGLTAALLVLFGVFVFGGSLMADWSELAVSNWSETPSMLPVIFLSLVFHDLIPVLCAYLDGDIKRVRTSILVGSLVPLSMFLSWDAVALALSHSSGFEDPLQLLMRTGGPAQALIIELFSHLAIATSFIGTALGMSEFFMEQIGNITKSADKAASPTSKPQSSMFASSAAAAKVVTGTGNESLVSRVSSWAKKQMREASFLLVLAPPLAIASAMPDAFLPASEAAGAYGMTTLYGVLPPLMFWSLHQSNKKSNSSSPQIESSSFWTKPGGDFALAGMGACACAVIAGQAMLDLTVTSPALMSESVVIAAGSPVSESDPAPLLHGDFVEPQVAPHVVG